MVAATVMACRQTDRERGCSSNWLEFLLDLLLGSHRRRDSILKWHLHFYTDIHNHILNQPSNPPSPANMRYSLTLLTLLPTLILSNPLPHPKPAAAPEAITAPNPDTLLLHPASSLHARAPPTTWPTCQNTLSCSFAAIEKTSLATRLTYLRNMQSKHFGPGFGAGNQWRAVEGVITFFQSKGLGAPGTWVSYTDAGIIEAIQRGGAIALGWSTATGGNPGSALWAQFLRDIKAGKLKDRAKHDIAWSQAEQACTDYGKSLADKKTPGPNVQTKRWFQFTQIFRAMMRNRATIIALIKSLNIPGLPFGFIISWFAERIFNWFTDITQTIPTVCGSDASWTLSALDIAPLTPATAIKNTALLNTILPKFVWCYIKNIF